MPRMKAHQRREQLIATAIRVFARSGYDGTTTAQIARAAGVTEPILYRHFRSKQELFAAIVGVVSSAAVRHLAQVAEGEPDPAQRIRKLCAAMPDHIRRMADAYHVLHGALTHSRDRRVIHVLRKHYRTMHRVFRDVIRQGQVAGTFRRNMCAKNAAWHIVMSGLGYATLSLNLDLIDRPTINETIEEFLLGLKR
ncbi:MAG: TetR/AcrR family transcriptional regulator [Phycisphaerae bacterium]|nr:TetR/AcrR family transcriptional regulator [Phycisphaerae bacterium]